MHGYTIPRRGGARAWSQLVDRPGTKLPGLPRRRAEDLPYAAIVLRRLVRATGARQVVFSAYGIREGWFLRQRAGRRA